tara:strand:- start:78 stop:470 length:393 start_codon:yes stop_codon:yes gene_type:complete
MQDSNNSGKRFRRIRFPVIGPMLIVCPICSGSKCNVCNNTGEYEMEREGYVEIQEPLIVRYIMDNIDKLSTEITRLYGKTPEVTTEIVNKNYEVIRVDSLSGSVWIAHSLKDNSSPKYFFNIEEMKKWLV